MKYFSLFSGIGGFELGIQQAYDNRPNIRNGNTDISGNMPDTSEQSNRATCVGYSEIDKYAIATYQSHFPNHKNYGDITKINEQELPDFDMLVGGFPCQAFSIAGKRKGFEDTRGTLFFDIARIIKAKQPRLVFLENVKGLLSHDNGETFRTIIATLDELGYDLQWQVLNSKNHGVPQNRERVFIVGHLRGTCRPKVFPFGTEAEMAIEPKQSTEVQIASTLAGAGGHIANGEYKGMNLLQVNNPIHSNDRVYKPNGISPTLNTMQGGDRQPFVAIRNDGMEVEMNVANSVTPDAYLTSGKRGLNEEGKSQLTSMCDRRIRRLTPIECERLQGFPDNWTVGSDTQRYKQCGNAVTVNVIRDIAERLLTPTTKP